MKKDYIGFGVVGILVGLIIGFFVGNAIYPGTNASPQTATAGPGGVSVNSPGSNQQQLPPNHPTIEPGKTVPAGPLPPGTADAPVGDNANASPNAAANAGGSPSLPSLDPLPAGSKEERTEQKYKNIQMLKGLPADRLMKIMFAFKDSLGVDCTYCHIKDQFEKDDKPEKQMARKMIAIVKDNNAKLGAARVSCYTCHRGQPRPPQ